MERLGSFLLNDTATTEIYTLSLHDALPISERGVPPVSPAPDLAARVREAALLEGDFVLSSGKRSPFYVDKYLRSEEHTSELQSRQYLVCRLLLEKKKLARLPPLLLLHSLVC